MKRLFMVDDDGTQREVRCGDCSFWEPPYDPVYPESFGRCDNFVTAPATAQRVCAAAQGCDNFEPKRGTPPSRLLPNVTVNVTWDPADPEAIRKAVEQGVENAFSDPFARLSRKLADAMAKSALSGRTLANMVGVEISKQEAHGLVQIIDAASAQGVQDRHFQEIGRQLAEGLARLERET